MLCGFIADVLPHCILSERNLFKSFLIDCVLKQANDQQCLKNLGLCSLFAQVELDDLSRQIADEEIFVPMLTSLPEWKFNSKLMCTEIGSIERQLISCTNANLVRKLLVKLAGTNPTKPLWTVNPSWDLATPIKSILMAMHPVFSQDFAYVVLGKARELTAKKDYVGAVC